VAASGRQRPRRVGASALALEPAEAMHYLPMPGTWAWNGAWLKDGSPFVEALRAQNFVPIRTEEGEPFNGWTTRLTGVVPWSKKQDWLAGADETEYFLKGLPYEWLNLFCHSHAGNVAIELAARGFKLRTLTTIATPNRADVPQAEAAKHIGYWQHLYDPERDLVASLRRRLGQIGDGSFSRERRILQPGVLNVPVPGMAHSRMVKAPGFISLLYARGLLDAVRLMDGSHVATD
jgi:hypothetical protein